MTHPRIEPFKKPKMNQSSTEQKTKTNKTPKNTVKHTLGFLTDFISFIHKSLRTAENRNICHYAMRSQDKKQIFQVTLLGSLKMSQLSPSFVPNRLWGRFLNGWSC